MTKQRITNSSEFPYRLSIHAAGMLMKGLIEYHEETKVVLEKELNKGYAFLRLCTTLDEAKRLNQFVTDLSENISLVDGIILDSFELIHEVESLKETYKDIE